MSNNYNTQTKRFSYLVCACGLVAAIFALWRLPIIGPGNLKFVFLTLAITIITLVSLKIPSEQFEYITVGDVLLFIIMLLFDGEAAILLASLQAMLATVGLRFLSKPGFIPVRDILTICFNGAVLGLTFFVAVWVVRFTLGPVPDVFANLVSPTAMMGLALAALAACLVNTLLVGIHQSLRHRKAFLEAWTSSSFKWVWITYIAGATTAALIVHLYRASGPYTLLLVCPLVVLIYLTYLTYFKKIEATAHAARAEAAQAAAMEASRLKEEFMANVSHEIRTPIHAVRGMTALLLNTRLTPEQQEYAATIHSSCNSLLSIVNDILDLSRAEANRLELAQQRFSVRECVEYAIKMFELIAAEKGLGLSYVMDNSVPEEVKGDLTRLRQVLVNLLGNAIKFTQAGEVSIQIRGRAPIGNLQELHFSVRDTGIGIAYEKRDRLFQPFSQVDSSITRQYGGSGLGLAISKRLVEMMGGSIWAETNDASEGSTFHFIVRLEPATSDSDGSFDNREKGLSGIRILIVGDGDGYCRVLLRQARPLGISPYTLESVDEALLLLQAGAYYDAIILHEESLAASTYTPEEILSRLSPDSKPLLLIVSPTGERGISAQAQRLDGCTILTRPMKPEHLFKVLASLVDNGAGPDARRNDHKIDTTLGQRFPLRILLAEDNLVNQRVTLHILKHMGYDADVVSNGRDAVEAARSRNYDLILMDLQMPQMDGLAAARRICPDGADGGPPYIIAMTASFMPDELKQCHAAGMVDYLSKPVRVDEFQKVLAHWSRKLRAGEAAGDTIHFRPQAVTNFPSSDVFDVTFLIKLREMQGGEGADIATELAELFLSETPLQLDTLYRVSESMDAEAIGRIAHLLKGSCLSIGATRMSVLCEELEIAAKNGSGDYKSLISKVKGEYSRVKQEIEACLYLTI